MTDLEEVEIQIDVANKIRALRDNCVKLMKNRAFRDVIEEGYFKEEAARLVMAKSAPLTDEQQKNIDGMIIGIGALSNYLNMVMRRGAEMDTALGEHEQTREEILAEELIYNGWYCLTALWWRIYEATSPWFRSGWVNGCWTRDRLSG